ncbi:sesquipedalian-1-like [Crotalus adamanteus]|uniref:Sesquipedalian n=1 Tax=Crotalus adamanteus TaxID=8729 RepID=A0AAW1AZU4_CROAD
MDKGSLIPVFYDFLSSFRASPSPNSTLPAFLPLLTWISPPDWQGVVYKKNNRIASYQHCWCELRGNLICWEQPCQLIVLEGCTVELQESSSEPHTFKICYRDDFPDQTYKMAAEDQETMEDWVHTLSTVGFEHLQALVTELEGQFHRLKSQQYSKEEASCKATYLPLLSPKPVEQRRFCHMDFTCLHQEFGKEVKRARKQWQEGKGKLIPESESLMPFE